MPPAKLRANRITALYFIAIKHLLALPLPAKCAVIVLLVLVVQSATLLLASARGNHQLIQEQSTLFAQQWVKQIAYLSREGLIRNDNVTLLSILRQQAENPLLGYARITDSDDKTLVEVGLHEESNPRFVSPIMIGQDLAGSVVLELQTAPLQSAQSSRLSFHDTGAFVCQVFRFRPTLVHLRMLVVLVHAAGYTISCQMCQAPSDGNDRPWLS